MIPAPGHVGTIVHAFPGRARRTGGHAPCPAIIMVVSGPSASPSVTMQVFHHDGTTEMMTDVVHEDRRTARLAAEPAWDADAAPFFRWIAAQEAK